MPARRLGRVDIAVSAGRCQHGEGGRTRGVVAGPPHRADGEFGAAELRAGVRDEAGDLRKRRQLGWQQARQQRVAVQPKTLERGQAPQLRGERSAEERVHVQAQVIQKHEGADFDRDCARKRVGSGKAAECVGGREGVSSAATEGQVGIGGAVTGGSGERGEGRPALCLITHPSSSTRRDANNPICVGMVPERPSEPRSSTVKRVPPPQLMWAHGVMVLHGS